MPHATAAAACRLLAVLSLLAVAHCRTPPPPHGDGLGVQQRPLQLEGGDPAAAVALWDRLTSGLHRGASYGGGGRGDEGDAAAAEWIGSYDDGRIDDTEPGFESLLAAISGLNVDPEREEGIHPAAAPPQRSKRASYCNPPNPCPKGKTAANDRCQEGVPNTEEFNRMYVLRQIERGLCPCDAEHNAERSCPTSPEYEVLPGTKNVDWTRIDALLSDTASSAPGDLDLRKIAVQLLAGKRRYQSRPLSSEVEHDRGEDWLEANGSYLSGAELARAAKKSPLSL